MDLLAISFIAGILTVLAPCVLPLLPVIIGGSLVDHDRLRPLIVTLSLAASVTIFTLLLKASAAFITIPPSVWKYFSAVIVGFFGVTLLFPNLWDQLAIKLGFQKLKKASDKKLFQGSQKGGVLGMIMTGMALGPVFTSCSPTYFIIVGTVLPASFGVGLLNLTVYSLGLATVMLIVAYSGQHAMQRLNILADPKGTFKKVLGVVFIFVAVALATGLDKKFESKLLDWGITGVSSFEERLLEGL